MRSGALEVRSTKVQNASSHPLRTGKEQGRFSGAMESSLVRKLKVYTGSKAEHTEASFW